jgi:catechol 2,3-dioxygenase-like lactoylglutathione lyase family enzyme
LIKALSADTDLAGAGLIVERTDFISVPVMDIERSTTFYGETLGLDLVWPDAAWPEFQLGENVSLYLIDPKNIGQEFTAPHSAHIALRVPDVEQTRSELESKGIEFEGATLDTGVCHMAFFHDPDGNALMLHRRYAPRD